MKFSYNLDQLNGILRRNGTGLHVVRLNNKVYDATYRCLFWRRGKSPLSALNNVAKELERRTDKMSLVAIEVREALCTIMGK